MMATIPLTLHGITWCWRHGHPIVGLQGRADEVFWITLAPDDAQSLSPMYQGHNTGRSRVYDLLESILESLGARVAATSLEFSPNGVLRGLLTIDSIMGSLTRPVHTVDAIVLAHRGQIPIDINEGDLSRICPPETQGAVSHENVEIDCPADPPDTFRAFIESLDLGQLDHPSG